MKNERLLKKCKEIRKLAYYREVHPHILIEMLLDVLEAHLKGIE